MKLGTLLLRNAAIGASQMEAALRNQVLYGGRLGTNLVELGLMSLEVLSAYLADQTGFPVATPTLLEHADRVLLDRLGRDDAQRLGALPIGYLSTPGAGSGVGSRSGVIDRSTAAVAMVDPTDRSALEFVGAKLATNVAPYVVPELRAAYYLERHFDAPRRARFLRMASRAEVGLGSGSERRRAQPAGGIAMPPTFTIEPRRRRESRPPVSSSVPTSVMYAAARERIETATHREQIADAFIDYARGRCDALALLVPRERNAVGWRSFVAPPAHPAYPLTELSLPLGGASALQVAHDSGETYIGAPPSPAAPVEAQLWNALGSVPAEREVAVLPVLAKRQPVMLIYAHCAAGPLPAATIGELQDFAQCAQGTYMRLMHQLWDA